VAPSRFVVIGGDTPSSDSVTVNLRFSAQRYAGSSKGWNVMSGLVTPTTTKFLTLSHQEVLSQAKRAWKLVDLWEAAPFPPCAICGAKPDPESDCSFGLRPVASLLGQGPYATGRTDSRARSESHVA